MISLLFLSLLLVAIVHCTCSLAGRAVGTASQLIDCLDTAPVCFESLFSYAFFLGN